jgi:hypothetical protein
MNIPADQEITPEYVRQVIADALDRAYEPSDSPDIDERRRHSEHEFHPSCYVCQRNPARITDTVMNAVEPVINNLLAEVIDSMTASGGVDEDHALFEVGVYSANRVLLAHVRKMKHEVDAFEDTLSEVAEALRVPQGRTLTQTARRLHADLARTRAEHEAMRFRVDAAETARQGLIHHQRELYEALGWPADIDPDDALAKAAELHAEVEKLRAEVARLRAALADLTTTQAEVAA